MVRDVLAWLGFVLVLTGGVALAQWAGTPPAALPGWAGLLRR